MCGRGVCMSSEFPTLHAQGSVEGLVHGFQHLSVLLGMFGVSLILIFTLLCLLYDRSGASVLLPHQWTVEFQCCVCSCSSLSTDCGNTSIVFFIII